MRYPSREESDGWRNGVGYDGPEEKAEEDEDGLFATGEGNAVADNYVSIGVLPQKYRDVCNKMRAASSARKLTKR
eukprot:9214007-Prorocentrum_lima.AAC.1